MIYEPREDSELLAEYVKKYARGIVLDMGTGSGIQALEAAKKKNVKEILAADIQKDAIQHCKNNIKLLNSKNSKGLEKSKTFQNNKKIKFIVSNLFSNIKNRYDTIIFNPPYLPEDVQLKDLTIDGGKKGYEIIERFLNNAKNYLKKKGIILMTFSSLTKKPIIDKIIKNNKLKYKLLDKKHILFEDIYVYMIQNG